MQDDNDQEYIDSLDDVFEKDREIINGDYDGLAEDNDPPAAPADDPDVSIPKDHQTTDQELDAHELYDEGLPGAADDSLDDERDIERGWKR